MEKFNNKLLFYFLFGALSLFTFFIFSNQVFAYTEITEDITADSFWFLEGSPYIVKNGIIVHPDVRLTINPGVVVKFDENVSLGVLGDLVVNGQENNKVYFTSINDDTVGGNSNEDIYCYEDIDEEGNILGEICEDYGADPQIQDWNGISFLNSIESSLSGLVLKYSNDALSSNASNIFINNSEIIDNYSGITAYQNSNINIQNTNFLNLNESAVVAYTNSSLVLENVGIKNILYGDGISVFNNSSITADNLNIENINEDNAQDILLFNNSDLILKNSFFKNCPSGACITFFDGDEYAVNPSTLNIESSKFEGGAGSAFLTFGDGAIVNSIKNSVIKDFSLYGVENYANFTVNVKNNFWGSELGPFHDTLNPSGDAGSLYGNVDFVPWCKNESCQNRNPVILIPGIMGSRLIKDYDDHEEIWPNFDKLILSPLDNFLDDLSFDEFGKEYISKKIITGDIIRELGGVHVFDGLIEKLTLGGYVEGVDLFVFPYDWRKSNKDNAVLLKNKIDEILIEANTGKVDLVAHSMGGILAKTYIADNGPDKVDKIIFLGTPHLGAPKAFKALMYGDDMGIKIGKIILLNISKIKEISQNMPGVFELLPSKKYVDGQDGFIGQKYVTDLVTPYISGINSALGLDLDYNQTKEFLIKEGKNTNIIPLAENLHNSIDNLDLSNINVYNFSGCGFTKTIGGIVVKKKKSWTSFGQKVEDDFQLNYVNGDETVPLHSSILPSGKQYYVKGYSHGKLPSGESVKEIIFSILGNETPSIFENIFSNLDSCYVSGKVVSVHSPATLEIYDANGNYAGPDESGDIVNEIPGVQYDIINDTKFAFLPDGDYRIVNNAEDTGAYDFYIENINENDEKTKIVYWNEVPLQTLQTNSEIILDSNDSSPVLKIDADGDGSFEKNILSSSILDSNKVDDLTPPETKNVVLGEIVTLMASDEISGVLKTEYSLNDGVDWLEYKNPIKIQHGIVKYFSIDKAGNIESIKILEIEEKKKNGSGSGYVHNFHLGELFSKDEFKKEDNDKKNDVYDNNKKVSNLNKNIDFNKKIEKEKTKKEIGHTNNQMASLSGFNFDFTKYWPIYIMGLVALFLIARFLRKR